MIVKMLFEATARLFSNHSSLASPVLFALLSVSSLTVLAKQDEVPPSDISLTQPSQVLLLEHQLQLIYPAPVRLDRVLNDAQQYNHLKSKGLSFHEGYKLFDLSQQSKVDNLLTSVDNRLQHLMKDSELTHAATVLGELLNSNRFAYRVNINLDLDAVRLKPELNPSLPGDYALRQLKRDEQVYVIGLVAPRTVIFKAEQTVADIMAQTQIFDVADSSRVWVIAPNGEAHQVGYRLWNDQQTSLLPGSILFVGFNAHCASLQHLERDIVTLLGMIKDPIK